MQYYSRSENQHGEKELVQDHLREVAALAKSFAEAFGFGSMAEWIGLLHDFGKYSKRFQDVLCRLEQHVDHAAPGAAIAEKLFSTKEEERKKTADAYKHMAAVIIAHHSMLCFHTEGFLDQLDPEYRSSDRKPSLSKEQLPDAWDIFKSEMGKLPGRKGLRIQDFSGATRFQQGIKYMLFQRMLLSALVDADYSCAAKHENPEYLSVSTGPPLDAAKALANLEARRREIIGKSTASEALNRIREQLYQDCILAAGQDPGLFTLTAPTGTGKTLALMGFALTHVLAHQQKRPMRRIFVVLPYLSIIQQNVEEYRHIVPELLELHSQADLNEETRLLAERCSAPLVVTTSVRFFEALFAAKAQRCRWLHEIAGSVIVFDEAQSLPPKVVRATLEALKVLCEQYGCTVVFSTATQPAFDHRGDIDWKPREIVADPQALFEQTRRVQVEWSIQQSTDFSAIAQRMAQYPQALAIVNVRRHARELYEHMAALCQEEELFFMTSDLCADHRRCILNQINQRLKDGLPCTLVATQCVEAGVDFSFPVVFRSLAPLEAIIQAAGRCNRNGSTPEGQVIVFLPEEAKYPDAYYELSAIKVKSLLYRHRIDLQDLEHIDEYYQLLYNDATIDSKKLLHAIASLGYEEAERCYQLIDSYGYQVVTPYDGTLFEAIRTQALAEGFTPALAAAARGITVACTDREAVRMYCEPIPYRKKRSQQALETGWYMVADPAAYSMKTGLCITDSFQNNPYIS